MIAGSLVLAGYYALLDSGASPANGRVPPLLLIPVVLLMALGVTTLVMSFWLRRRPQQRLELVNAWPRSRALLLVVTMSLLAIVLFAFGAFFLQWNRVAHWVALEAAVLTILFLAIIFISWIGLRRALILPSEDPALIEQLLHRRPHEIAWVYEIVVSSVGGKADEMTTVCLWLTNGRSHQISLPHPEAHMLLDLVRECAPHARIGYSEVVEARYRQDPASFSRKTS